MSLLELYKIDLETYINVPAEQKRNYLRYQIQCHDKIILDLIDSFNKRYSEEELLEMENPKEMNPKLHEKIIEKNKSADNITKEINRVYFKVLEELSVAKQKLNSNNLVGENKWTIIQKFGKLWT